MRIFIFACLFSLALSNQMHILNANNERIEEFPSGVSFVGANFGYYPYGRTIHGFLEIAEAYNACYQLSSLQENREVLIAIRAKECSDLTQAFNAQVAGAKLFIMIDNTSEDITSEHIVDDGSGNHIMISTVLIGNEEGKDLLKYLQENDDDLQVQLYFPNPVKTETIKVDYWFSASDKNTYQFFNSFYPIYRTLHKKIIFEPHVVLFHNHSAKENGYACADCENCLGGGKYCAEPRLNLTGRQAVYLDLTVLCASKVSDNSNQWLRFMKNVGKKCIDQPKPVEDMDACVSQQLENARFSKNKTLECITNSFEVDSSKFTEMQENFILKQEMEVFKQENVMVYPELYINRKAIRGDISVKKEVFSAICSGFDQYEYPSQCEDYMPFKNSEEELVPLAHHSWASYFLLIIICLLTSVAIFYCFRRCMSKEIVNYQNHINSAVTDYMHFVEGSKKDITNV